MTFSMTRFAESYTIRHNVSKFWICSKWFDVVRVYLNSFAVAFVIMCATILACVIVSSVNSLAPLNVFVIETSEFVLMALWWFVFSLCFIGSYSASRTHFKRNGCKGAGERTEFSFSALLFVFRHRLITLRAKCGYLHAGVANAFRVGFFSALKSSTTNKAGFPDSMCISVEMRGTRSASLDRFFSEQSNTWGLFPAIRTWAESLFVTRLTYPIITRIVSAYLTSVFHVSTLPQVTNEYSYD